MNRGAVAGVREGKRRGTVNGHPPAAEETASYRLKQMFLIELRLASRRNIKRPPMSALGQKQTSAYVRVMSALPRKRTSEPASLLPSTQLLRQLGDIRR